jgi:hypothetical protein
MQYWIGRGGIEPSGPAVQFRAAADFTLWHVTLEKERADVSYLATAESTAVTSCQQAASLEG